MKKRKIVLVNLFLSFYTRFWGRLKPRNTLDARSEFSRIVVYSTTALGDMMFSTPALRALRERYPQADITLVAHPKNRALIESYARIDRVVYWKCQFRTLLGFVYQIREFKPELAVVLHAHQPYDVISAVMAGCQYIIHDNYGWTLLGLERWLAHYQPGYKGHTIQRRLDLLTKIGCRNEDVRMEIPCPYPDARKTGGRKVVGFQMGASKPEKSWPVGQFAGLARLLLDENDEIDVVLIGMQQEIELGESFMSSLPEAHHHRVKNRIGKTALPELIAAIEQMDVLITNDTGPLHLAIAVQTPTVSLYLATDPGETGPYQDPGLHQIIQALPDADGGASMRTIPTETVLVAVRNATAAFRNSAATAPFPSS